MTAFYGGSDLPDPFIFNESLTGSGFSDRAGKAISDPRLVADERTAVLVIAGQSNCCNTVDTLYTPTNAGKVDNLSIYDGGTYRAIDPLVGCENGVSIHGNTFGRVADKLIDGHVFDRVILVPIGMGATSIAEWAPGGVLNSRILVGARRAAARGLPITAFLWVQGETDQALGTTQSAYASALAGVIGTPRAEGFNAPWFIGLSTLNEGVASIAVRAACSAVVNGSDIFAGADTDSLTGGTYRQADNTHFTAVGSDAAAALWKTAIDAVF